MTIASSRRLAILEAATRLFEHYGHGKTTIADVAREAQIGVGTVYLEFESKEAIVQELSRSTHVAVLEAMRADALVVQGLAAGGHSATFDPSRDPADIETVDLVRSVTAATDLPAIAGGGVDGPAAVAGLLEAGASAVSVGTLLLRTEESGASQLHKDALADPRFEETALTRAFTGRPARSLRNEFVDRHDREAPTGYPEVHLMTREFRVAAAKQGDRESVHLWAGTGYRNAAVEPAGALVRRLAGVD
ncbi:MAG: nitronate monooxygenase [Solirubrobacterales bacterium]|nr:nitronate monooxygenase [Solirubrobacterales bacterium]